MDNDRSTFVERVETVAVGTTPYTGDRTDAELMADDDELAEPDYSADEMSSSTRLDTDEMSSPGAGREAVGATPDADSDARSADRDWGVDEANTARPVGGDFTDDPGQAGGPPLRDTMSAGEYETPTEVMSAEPRPEH
jgi:hypothetical protein